jgi:homocysteine S-methyltransferase
LRRSAKVELHPRLEHALLIYDKISRKELSRVYDDYIAVAHAAKIPIMTCAPTWRANKERLSEAHLSHDVNKDLVYFMKELRKNWKSFNEHIFIGGLVGCKHDCYTPDAGLSAEHAYDFHAWQIDRLAQAGVDFLAAETLPAVPEAKGMARAMAKTGLPYFISFVIDRNGEILDQTPLESAFNDIDSACEIAPTGFMINCAYPSFLHAHEQPDTVMSRLIGYLANASSLDHSELDRAASLKTDDISDWGDRLIELNQKYHIKILGGCCGTGPAHLQYIVDNIHT